MSDKSAAVLQEMHKLNSKFNVLQPDLLDAKKVN